MKKIPVGAAIAQAYRFAVREFLNVLKLVWLPLVAATALNIVLQPQAQRMIQGLRTHDFSIMTIPAPLVALGLLVAALLSLMQVTAIFQYALNRPEAQGRWFYFSLGRPFWRMLGGLLLLILAMAGLLLVYVIAVMAVLFVFRLGLTAAHVSDAAMKGIMVFDGALAFLIGYCGAIFCMVRFGFLLFAATIVEERISLFRSWALSHSNFWRMFVILLAIFLPFLIVEVIGLLALGIFPHYPPGASVEQIRALQNAQSAAATARIQQFGVIIYPVSALLGLLLYALAAGAQIFGYRALTEGPPSANPP